MYAAVLTLVQRQGIQERAVDVWTAVLQDGVRQTPHLFSSLFAGARVGLPRGRHRESRQGG